MVEEIKIAAYKLFREKKISSPSFSFTEAVSCLLSATRWRTEPCSDMMLWKKFLTHTHLTHMEDVCIAYNCRELDIRLRALSANADTLHLISLFFLFDNVYCFSLIVKPIF